MLPKSQFSFFKIILIIGLLLVEGLCFAENENPTTNPIVDTNKPTPDPEEEHDTQDLEQLLKRYNTDQEAILNDADKLHGDSGSNVVHEDEISEMPRSEIRPDPKRKDTLSEVYEKRMRFRKKGEILPTNLSNSVKFVLQPLQKLSEEDLLKRLDESTIDSPIRPYINQFPNMTKYFVRLLKDSESVPSLIKILEDKDTLIWFIGVMLSTIIFGILLKKYMHREGRSFPISAFYFFVRFFIMILLRVAVVYYFYSKELSPAARVFKSTFM